MLADPTAIDVDDFRRQARAALDEMSDGGALIGPAWMDYTTGYGHPAAVLALLDALEAKKAQHAETLGMLEGAYAEIERMRVALEAAQRPPLGMRDIADTLAFIALRIVGGLLQTELARGHLRKDLADAFEELLNNLPEGEIAAQRPPLGYMAVEDSEEPRSPTGRWVVPMSAIFPTAEECQPTLDLYTPLDGVTPARDARRFVAEVREVQP